MKALRILLIIVALAFLGAYYMYRHFPANKIPVRSQLIMIGDLDNDNKWDSVDEKILNAFLTDPFAYSAQLAYRIDANKNGLIDSEDIELLKQLYRYKDPYLLQSVAIAFPRAREFFRYLPDREYVQRPLYILNGISKQMVLPFLHEINVRKLSDSYTDELLKEIYDEGIRFVIAYKKRESSLSEIEKDYARRKLAVCSDMYNRHEYYNLLLNLMGLLEDAETLSISGQSEFIKKILYLRDDLAKILVSKTYKEFEGDKSSYKDVLAEMEKAICNNLGYKVDIENLEKPRDYKKLKNYIERAQWQYYKSSLSAEDFIKLVLFAQYDRRYLRAVSNTNRKYEDLSVQNHNLPMILLFREALRIKGGDKKKAVALLDESIRIPFAWVKSISLGELPKSLALENFLLPGNKEDGSDKSRHWNVFGGICLYKSPEESFRLALSRESQDLKANNYSKTAMREFVRDTIANINGIYYVVSINPKLVYSELTNINSE